MSGQKKDIALEALRGMAALAVVLGHCWITFNVPGLGIPQLLHIVVSGSAAVMFFFVLSGYVLTRRFIETESYASLANSVLKRWFRLAGPVTLSFLLSAALFALGWYRYQEVASIINSPWLAMFGYAIPPTIGFVPSFHGAFIQGAFYIFFVQGHQYYNSPLGTMYYEAVGSFLVFGVAFIAVLMRKVSPWLMVAFWLISLAGATHFSPYYVSFIAGLGISLLFDKRQISLPAPITGGAIALAVYLLSFDSPYGYFAWMEKIGATADRAPYVWLVASVLLIAGVELNQAVSRRLSGRVGAFLGKLSFPIYLVHFLVLCSLGCATWLALLHYGRAMATLAIPVTIAGSVIAALPFIAFDRWWTANINRLASTVIKVPGAKRVSAGVGNA